MVHGLPPLPCICCAGERAARRSPYFGANTNLAILLCQRAHPVPSQCAERAGQPRWKPCMRCPRIHGWLPPRGSLFSGAQLGGVIYQRGKLQAGSESGERGSSPARPGLKGDLESLSGKMCTSFISSEPPENRPASSYGSVPTGCPDGGVLNRVVGNSLTTCPPRLEAADSSRWRV